MAESWQERKYKYLGIDTRKQFLPSSNPQATNPLKKSAVDLIADTLPDKGASFKQQASIPQQMPSDRTFLERLVAPVNLLNTVPQALAGAIDSKSSVLGNVGNVLQASNPFGQGNKKGEEFVSPLIRSLINTIKGEENVGYNYKTYDAMPQKVKQTYLDQAKFDIMQNRDMKVIEEFMKGKSGSALNYNNELQKLLSAIPEPTPKEVEAMARDMHKAYIGESNQNYSDPFKAIDFLALFAIPTKAVTSLPKGIVKGSKLAKEFAVSKLAKTAPLEQLAQIEKLPSVKPVTKQGTYTIKNTPFEKATKEHQQAVAQITDYLKQNKLNTNQINQISKDMGINLENIRNNVEMAQSLSPKQILKLQANISKFKPNSLKSRVIKNINEYPNKPITPTTGTNAFKIKNVPFENASKEHQQALNEIHNYFQQNELRASEIAKIKSELAIDVAGIIKKLENTETLTPREIIKMQGDISRLKSISGLGTPIKTKTISKIIQQSKIPKVTPITKQGEFKIKNTPLERATNEQQKALNEIKTYLNENMLNESKIKSELGIDLNGLVKKLENTENLSAKEILKIQSDMSKVKSVVGVNSAYKTKVINKIKEMPKKQPLTDAEFDAMYGLDKPLTKENMVKLIEAVGQRVIENKGTSNLKELLNIYREKYNLPEIKLLQNLRKSTKLGTTTPIENGYRININPNQSEMSKVAALRHEIEHVKDLHEGHNVVEKVVKPHPKKTARQSYEEVNSKAHKNYKFFEADYLKKIMMEENKPLKATAKKSLKSESNVMQTPSKSLKSRSRSLKSEKRPPLPETGKRVESSVSKTTRTHADTPESIKQMLDKNPIMYNQLSNKTTLASAKARFDEGYEKALYSYLHSEHIRPDDVPLSQMLAREAAKRGDMEKVEEILAKSAMQAVEAGRASQAHAILMKSNPATIHATLNRQIEKFNKLGRAEYGKRWNEIKLSDDLKKEIYNLEMFDEAATQRALNKADREIQSQIPATFYEKSNAVRRMMMLFNPTTHIRNFLGNELYRVTKLVSDGLAQIGESIILRNKSELKTKSATWRLDENLRKVTKDDWHLVKKDLANTGKFDINNVSLTQGDKKIFDTKALEAMNKLTHTILNAGDIPFLRYAYRDSLGQIMHSRGLKEVTEEVRQYAIGEALRATYRNTNKLANLINEAKRTRGVGMLAEAAIPFSKTPANIAVAAFDFSPAGLLKLIWSRDKSAAQKIDTVARSLTGTGVMALGAYLASMGYAKAKASVSRKAEMEAGLSGILPYSVKMPWGYETFEWANPISVPFAMGMEMYNAIANKDEKEGSSNSSKLVESLIRMGTAGVNTYADMSMLKSLIDVVGYKGQFGENLMKLPLKYVEQAIFPSLAGKIARSMQDNIPETYSPDMLTEYANTARTRLPLESAFKAFGAKDLPDRLDYLGRPIKQSGVGHQMLNPGRTLSESNDPVDKTINAIYKANDESTKLLPNLAPKQIEYKGKNMILKSEEYVRFQKTMGQYIYNHVNQSLVGADPTSKSTAKKLETIIANGRELARKEFLRGRK